MTEEKQKKISVKGKPIDMTHKCLFNPRDNAKIILLEEQADGNWVGIAQRNGKLVSVREGMPEHALTKLLTHP